MSGDKRWPYSEALAVAEELRDFLAGACKRIEIAGSLRRQREDVGDIELLCIPLELGLALGVDTLDRAIQTLMVHDVLALRPDVKGRTTYGSQNKLMLHVLSGIGVDIFSTTTEHWGMAMVVRTGSAEFNIKMMARFRQLGFQGHAYPWNGKGKQHGSISTPNGEIDCPTEEDVFRVLGWQYIDPRERK